MKLLNQDKHIIPIDGTRIETMWSTIEKGIDESGNEYETSRQLLPEPMKGRLQMTMGHF